MPEEPVRSRAEIEQRLDGLARTFVRLGVRSLALFGSAARDTLGPRSDVDLLVEFDGPARFDAFMELKLLLEDRLGRRVDLLTPRALHPLLAERIEGDLAAWFAAMDRHGDVPFMADGRDQPMLPEDAAERALD